MQRVALARVLGLGDLSVLSSASMAPAYSIAATFGLMVAASGFGAPLALVVLAIPAAFIAIAFHRLCEEQPEAGSTYAWTRIAFGARFALFAGWIVVLSYFVASVASVVPAGIYSLSLLWPGAAADTHAVALVGGVWVIGAGVLLMTGMRPTANTTALFLSLEFAALLFFAILAFTHPAAAQSLQSPKQLLGLGSGGFAGFLSAMVLAIWVTDGWEVSTYTSEEHTGSDRNPGLGGLIALTVTVGMMVLCSIAFMRVAPVQGIADHATDTLAYVALQLGGGWRSWLMVLTVLASSGAALWTTQLGLSRLLFSAARNGTLPASLATVHPKFGTPVWSIVVVSAGALALTLLIAIVPSVKAALSEVVNASSILLGLTYIFTGAACVWYFAKRRVPLTDATRIVLPALGTLAVTALLVVNFRSQSFVDQVIALICVVVGIIIAALVGKRPGAKAPALQRV
ncbi:MAG TPA: APC family permease [Candidatus Tumulicola sp.]|nr:APC family permease [Candidatus Tumulicola sp.]